VKRRRFRIAGAFALLLSSQAFPEQATIRGTIRFPDGEVPPYSIASLVGNAYSRTVDCDDDGRFAFEDVPNGRYKLLAFGGGKRNQAGAATKRDIRVSADTPKPLVVDVTLLISADEIRAQ
jgi:hypothetical protein